LTAKASFEDDSNLPCEAVIASQHLSLVHNIPFNIVRVADEDPMSVAQTELLDGHA
jgi:hypothetical protein